MRENPSVIPLSSFFVGHLSWIMRPALKCGLYTQILLEKIIIFFLSGFELYMTSCQRQGLVSTTTLSTGTPSDLELYLGHVALFSVT